MTTEFKWIISSMDEYPKTADDLVDVVCIVHWRRAATAIVDEKTYTAECYSTLSVPAPSPEDFTPYPDLTFEQVCGWLEAGLDTEAIDASLLTQIEQQINPPIISLPLPWTVSKNEE